MEPLGFSSYKIPKNLKSWPRLCSKPSLNKSQQNRQILNPEIS